MQFKSPYDRFFCDICLTSLQLPMKRTPTVDFFKTLACLVGRSRRSLSVQRTLLLMLKLLLRYHLLDRQERKGGSCTSDLIDMFQLFQWGRNHKLGTLKRWLLQVKGVSELACQLKSDAPWLHLWLFLSFSRIFRTCFSFFHVHTAALRSHFPYLWALCWKIGI